MSDYNAYSKSYEILEMADKLEKMVLETFPFLDDGIDIAGFIKEKLCVELQEDIFFSFDEEMHDGVKRDAELLNEWKERNKRNLKMYTLFDKAKRERAEAEREAKRKAARSASARYGWESRRNNQERRESERS